MDPQYHAALLDILCGVNAVYSTACIDTACWVVNKAGKKIQIECFIEGPNSNFCMNLNEYHHSSRAKFVVDRVRGVQVRCTCRKVLRSCERWAGTEWAQLDPAYRAALFLESGDGDGEAGGVAAHDLPALVDAYPFLKPRFGGAENVAALRTYNRAKLQMSLSPRF